MDGRLTRIVFGDNPRYEKVPKEGFHCHGCYFETEETVIFYTHPDQLSEPRPKPINDWPFDFDCHEVCEHLGLGSCIEEFEGEDGEPDFRGYIFERVQ